jgi:hypothetical protein
MAKASAEAGPQGRPRLQHRLAGWWSHWLGRHAPLMDDPAPGRLDRFDGVTPGSERSSLPERLGGSGAAPDLPGREAAR